MAETIEVPSGMSTCVGTTNYILVKFIRTQMQIKYYKRKTRLKIRTYTVNTQYCQSKRQSRWQIPREFEILEDACRLIVKYRDNAEWM